MKTKITSFLRRKNFKAHSLLFLCLISFFSHKGQNLLWANAMLGPGGGQGTEMVVDASGNVYTTGAFSGTTDFDPGVGIFTLTPSGGIDAYVSKLDASRNFVWAKLFGSSGIDGGQDIALDAAGDVYSLLSLGNTNYIYKLSAAGSTVWIKNIGGTGESITLDASGNIYVSGGFAGSSDFDPGAGSFTMTAAGTDIFVSKLDPSGTFIWAKKMGGTGSDASYGVAVDASGNVCITGGFSGTADLDPGAGSYTVSSGGMGDIFISKLDASGNFVWATAMGWYANDLGYSIACDGAGNIYTTGNYVGTVDFDPGAGTYFLSGSASAFVLKLNASGTFGWAKNVGGAPQSIALDAAGNVYTAGGFLGTEDFDPGVGTYTLTSAGNYDGYISKLNASGNFVYAGAFGGADYDICFGLALSAAGIAHVTGFFNGTADFDPSAGVFNLAGPGTTAGYIFVVKLGTTALGINEATNVDNTLYVYPNPSNGNFTLQLKEELNGGELIVTDVMGREIFKEELKRATQQIELNINVKGLYFMRLDSEGKRMTKKIVVE